MKKHLSTILLFLIFLIGLSLLLYPTFADWWNSLHQSRAIASYSEAVADIDDDRYKQIWDAAWEYNQSLIDRPNSFLLSEEHASVGGWILQVDLLVGDIQITAYDHRLDTIQLYQILPESIIPLEPVVQTCQFPLCVGRVAGDQEEVGVFQGDKSSLGIQFGVAKAVGNRQWLQFCKNSCTGVSFFLRITPMLAVAGKLQLDLSSLQLCLLQTEKVSIGSGEEVQKAFLHTGPQTVYIPGN